MARDGLTFIILVRVREEVSGPKIDAMTLIDQYLEMSRREEWEGRGWRDSEVV